MSLTHCEQFCADFHRCWFVVHAMRRYRAEHKEPSPMEKLVFSERQLPACLIPREGHLVPGGDYNA